MFLLCLASLVLAFDPTDKGTEECKVLNCDSCSSTYVCDECLPGYFEFADGCTACSVLDTACLECTDSSTCTACSIGHFPEGDGCSPCHLEIEGCEECVDGQTCTLCSEGYGLVENADSSVTCEVCAESMEGCSTCSPRSDVNLFVNGDFEAEDFGDYDTTTVITGWTLEPTGQ